MDSLPVEICSKIFEHLNAKELARCSMVSRRWRQLCTDDRLWKRLATDEDLGNEDLVPPPDDYDWGPVSNYKTWYGRRLNSLRCWKENRSWAHNVDEESSLCVMGNGAILVEVRRNEMRVVNVSDGQPEAVETVRPQLPVNTRRLGQVEAFNEAYLVVRAEGPAVAFLCYAWRGGRLVFLDGVYGLYRDKVYTENIVLASTRGRSDVPAKSSLVQWKSVTIGRERLVLRTFDDRSTAYVWSLTESRCLGVLDCRSIAHGDIYSYGEDFFFCTFVDKLIKCDGTGVKTFSRKLDLNKHWISGYFVHFNPSGILLELRVQSATGRPPPEGFHRLIVLDWGFETVASVCSEHDQLALHPRLPIVSTCKKHSYRSLFEVALRDLRTDQVLWSVDFSPVSHSATVLDRYTFANLNFVGGAYVILVLSEVHVEKLLLDVDTGGALFHDVLEKCHTTEYVGDKVIVAWDSECEGLTFKKVVVYT